MQYGFVKVRAASPHLQVADVLYNLEEIKKAFVGAEKDGVELLVLPELSLCGYTCGDLLLQPTLLDGCEEALKQLIAFSVGKRAVLFVGLPVACKGKLYNCAAAICNGKLLAVIPKRNIPNYGEFYEARYFTAGEENVCSIAFAGQTAPFGTKIILQSQTNKYLKIACEICEDLWVAQSPSVSHAEAGATVIVNLSASSELVGKTARRRTVLQAQSAKLACCYVYADAGIGESSSDVVFAGHNLIAENGKILSESAIFSGEYAQSDVDVQFLQNERTRRNTFCGKTEGYTFVCFDGGDGQGKMERVFRPLPFIPEEEERKERCELILTLQAQALAKRIRHINAKTAVIGISGGLDSSLAFLVAVRAFEILKKPMADLIAITMPGFGTSKKTKKNSLALMQAMGATSRTVDIVPACRQHFVDIGHDEDVYDVTYENTQARYRTMILMDVANKTGGIVLGTGDLSEAALGWCTYNGDHMSMYSVNCSIPKTLVRTLVAHESERLGGEVKEILQSILGTDISPELLPPDKQGEIAQKTEDLVGPYELHDFYLYHVLRRGDSPKKICFLAQSAFAGRYEKAEICKWLKVFYKRFFTQQFKRSCAPDGVKVGTVGLSSHGDWRMPSDATYTLWLKELDEVE